MRRAGYGRGMTSDDKRTRITTTRLSGRRAALKRIIATAPSERRAATQSLLLESGKRLIIDKGLGATSVGDICTDAGFTRGAFYSNFADMDHFVERLAQEQWTQILTYVHTAVDEVLTARSDDRPLSDTEVESAIAPLAESLLTAMPISRDFYMLQSELATYTARAPEKTSALRTGYEAFTASLCSLLVSGLKAIGRETIPAPEDVTALIIAAGERSMRAALTKGEDGLTSLLERVLPTLLVRLSAPIADSHDSHEARLDEMNEDGTRP